MEDIHNVIKAVKYMYIHYIDVSFMWCFVIASFVSSWNYSSREDNYVYVILNNLILKT